MMVRGEGLDKMHFYIDVTAGCVCWVCEKRSDPGDLSNKVMVFGGGGVQSKRENSILL